MILGCNDNNNLTPDSSDQLSYRTAFKYIAFDSIPYVAKSLVTAAHTLLIPWIISSKKEQLAEYSSIKPWYTLILTIGLANLYSIFIQINKRVENHFYKVGIYLRQGVLLTLALSGLGTALILGLPTLFSWFAQPQEVIDELNSIKILLIFSLVTELFKQLSTYFLNSVDKTFVTAIAELGYVSLDMILNYLLVIDLDMGLSGTLISNMISGLLSVGIMTAYIIIKKEYFAKYQLFNLDYGFYSHKASMQIIKTAIPRGVDKGTEKIRNNVISLIIGTQGEAPLIAKSIEDQYSEAIHQVTKEIHKAFVRRAGVDSSHRNSGNVQVYKNLAIVTLLTLSCAPLVYSFFYSKNLISFTVDTNDSENNNIVNLAKYFLLIKLISTAVLSVYKGSEVYFSAKLDTTTPMILSLATSVLSILTLAIMSAAHSSLYLIYISELCGIVPTSFAAYKLSRQDDFRYTRKPILTSMSYQCSQDNSDSDADNFPQASYGTFSL